MTVFFFPDQKKSNLLESFLYGEMNKTLFLMTFRFGLKVLFCSPIALLNQFLNEVNWEKEWKRARLHWQISSTLKLKDNKQLEYEWKGQFPYNINKFM